MARSLPALRAAGAHQGSFAILRQVSAARWDPRTLSGFYNQSNAASVTYANSLTHGWQARPNDWMMSFSVQQEVTRGIAVSVGYYRTWFGNRMVAQNTAIPATGYDQYCETPTASTAYSGFGGTPLCNLYDPMTFSKERPRTWCSPLRILRARLRRIPTEE